MRNLYTSICLLSLIGLFCLLSANSALAQQDSSGFTISMPVEYVNYTIVSMNGSLWAKIDGTYPMYISGDVPSVLSMVYPTPPQTTNIHITLDGKELPYSNYTETFSYARHHTAIGDWEMVDTVISPVSEAFTLKIHYEHPLQTVNGSYLFLYDLNISPYISTENNNSTAYFTVRMETNTSDVRAFTTETDTKWNPINYTLRRDGNMDLVSIVMHSQYDTPLLGDLVVEFLNADSIPEYNVSVLVAVIAVLSGSIIVAKKCCRRLIHG